MEGGRLLDSYLKEERPGKVSKIFTKFLCSVIFLLASLIFTSINDECLTLYKKNVFEDSFNFMDFKNFYEELTSSKRPGKDAMVFGSSLEYTDISSYQNGEQLSIGTEVPINALSGGIVVFIGEKEGYNKTVIVQGSDGYDIWYGNLENIDIKIYDYLNAGSIMAMASDKLYLLITKDGKYYTYEEYQSQV